ncbi:MAG: hypothetical protein ACI4PE_00125 [Bacilli bacterium]
MNDIYGYDKLKKTLDKKKEDDIDFKVKMVQTLDDEYKNTGFYNGYDVRGKALKDHDEIMEKHGVNVVAYDGDVNVNKKSISKESKNKKLKIVLTAIATGAILSFFVIGAADFLNHPESYFTTHPNFEGTPTISELLQRTPENFGIGGR